MNKQIRKEYIKFSICKDSVIRYLKEVIANQRKIHKEHHLTKKANDVNNKFFQNILDKMIWKKYLLYR